jgi:hypothetical protein
VRGALTAVAGSARRRRRVAALRYMASSARGTALTGRKGCGKVRAPSGHPGGWSFLMGTPARDLGKKYTCFKCTCKFYDLSRPEPLCPRCGADQREDPNPDPREAFLARFRRPTPAPKQQAPREEEFEPDLAEEDDLLPVMEEDEDAGPELDAEDPPMDEEPVEEN